MVTGLDLVAEQLRVAEGERISFRQEDVRSHGHAIECRICAEDPGRGHTPTTGEVALLAPAAGPGVRFDSGLCEGQAITTAFDSMLAKLIVARLRPRAGDRPHATRRCATSCCSASHTTRPTSSGCSRIPPSHGASFTPHFLEQHHPDLASSSAGGAELAALLAGATLVDKGAGGEMPPSPTRRSGEWRN